MKMQEKRTIPTNIENKTKSNMTIKTKKKAKMKDSRNIQTGIGFTIK
jgi:hypothetical protein